MSGAFGDEVDQRLVLGMSGPRGAQVGGSLPQEDGWLHDHPEYPTRPTGDIVKTARKVAAAPA